jgi:hypothetical protein
MPPIVLADDTQKILMMLYSIGGILIFVLVFVTFTGCKRRDMETFISKKEVPKYNEVKKKVDNFEADLVKLDKRVCVLDSFTSGGMIADFETVMALKMNFTTKEDFEKDRPARNRKATQEMNEKRTSAFGTGCDRKPVMYSQKECFEDMKDSQSEATFAEWQELEKRILQCINKFHLLSYVLFRWISPNVRGFGAKAGIEAFADYWEQCAVAGAKDDEVKIVMPEVPEDYKHKLNQKITQVVINVPKFLAEIDYCEKVRQKMVAKKERLERGEITAGDLALGSSTASSATGQAPL